VILTVQKDGTWRDVLCLTTGPKAEVDVLINSLIRAILCSHSIEVYSGGSAGLS